MFFESSFIGSILIFSLSSVSRAEVFGSGIYPESALVQAQKEEDEEAKRLEEAKASSLRFSQEYERHKEDTEREIRATRRQIEDLKMAQEAIEKDQDFLKADLSEIQNKRNLIQKRYQDLLLKMNKQTVDRDALRAEVEKSKSDLKQDQMALKSLEDEITTKDVRPVSRWILTDTCVGRSAPDESAKTIAKFQKTKFVFGRPNGDYIKLLSSSGVPIFLNIKCVKESVSR